LKSRRERSAQREEAEQEASRQCAQELREREVWIDYEALLPSAEHRQLDAAVAVLKEEIPYAWFDRYARLTPHPTNVSRIDVEGFEYLFDAPEELVRAGSLAAADAVQDRLVGAHGLSRSEKEAREKSAARLADAPRGPAEVVDGGEAPYDRGHMMAHSIGGGLDLNLVPQLASVNRWGLWRRMERYCQQQPGSYVFCCPVYFGPSGHPAFIEYGVLKPDCSLWLNVFRNYRTVQELDEIERLYRDRKIE
jgi:hypothetical protein